MSQRIVAIIPARGGSKGIPKKNIIPFCGKPLLAWSIMQAKRARLVDEVYVSTDSAEIAAVAKQYGAEIIERPGSISGDTATSESALQHALTEIRKGGGTAIDYVVFLQATSPLREPSDIDTAIQIIQAEKADSLFSAAAIGDFYIWKKEGRRLTSVNYDYKNRGRRQEYDEQYVETGSLYVFKPKILFDCGNRLGGNITLSKAAFWKSFEIDEPEQIDFCALLFKRYGLDKV